MVLLHSGRCYVAVLCWCYGGLCELVVLQERGEGVEQRRAAIEKTSREHTHLKRKRDDLHNRRRLREAYITHAEIHMYIYAWCIYISVPPQRAVEA